jgi:hypothetical protein
LTVSVPERLFVSFFHLRKEIKMRNLNAEELKQVYGGHGGSGSGSSKSNGSKSGSKSGGSKSGSGSKSKGSKSK